MARLAIVRKEKCNPLKCAELCIRLCPINRTQKDCIKLENGKAYIDEVLCTGCGICSNRCPTEAISIINLPEQLKDKPIHRFGKNGFSLYRLPIPKPGEVVGILGRNGIGKTTALQILAGLSVPNLDSDNDNYDKVISFFKGTELQAYFTKLKNKEIKISFKPQKVDDIPKSFDGKVIDLLKKFDEKKKLKEIADKLDIDNILDNDIKNISGGELQRVAIAACVLKKANVYYFDEPSSYLDIKQRLKIANFIRELADAETSVLVVEHDLIVLDYMVDYVHIFYGNPGCYGIVSQPMASKVGINTYLDGYIKSENIRFRDKKIEFLEKAPVKIKDKEVYASWPAFDKKLGSFQLNAHEGKIDSYSVVGILGENGIGKTTFVKILAGLINPDTIKLDMKLSIAYKPQYLEIKEDLLVSQFLKDAILKYKSLIIRPLEIESLLLRKLSQLSGGELQKVVIAYCLSQDVDLYLIDEPSAYLDVEQRLITSKVIKDVMEHNGKAALVVDHDLLFIDYLSNELIVFDGVPSLKGVVNSPIGMEKGMNMLLRNLTITLRRDEISHRPKINKPGSLKDREQKDSGKLYYS